MPKINFKEIAKVEAPTKEKIADKSKKINENELPNQIRFISIEAFNDFLNSNLTKEEIKKEIDELNKPINFSDLNPTQKINVLGNYSHELMKVAELFRSIKSATIAAEYSQPLFDDLTKVYENNFWGIEKYTKNMKPNIDFKLVAIKEKEYIEKKASAERKKQNINFVGEKGRS